MTNECLLTPNVTEPYSLTFKTPCIVYSLILIGTYIIKKDQVSVYFVNDWNRKPNSRCLFLCNNYLTQLN